MAKHKRKKPRYQLEEELKNRILANPEAQAPNNSWNPPTYYDDQHFQCIDCGADAVWTAKQQQWWYEVAKGPIYSQAVRCRECREKLRHSHGGTPRRTHAERRLGLDQNKLTLPPVCNPGDEGDELGKANRPL